MHSQLQACAPQGYGHVAWAVDFDVLTTNLRFECTATVVFNALLIGTVSLAEIAAETSQVYRVMR
jgi:hypothetical protein